MKLSRLWYLEQFDLLERLDKEDKMRLADCTVMKSYERNAPIIFSATNKQYIYFLKKGIIKIGSYTATGEEDLKYLLKAGSIFGELALADRESPNDLAIAVEDCLVCSMEASIMKEVMEKNKHISNQIIKLMGLRIRKLERRMESILFKDSKSRIIEFIADFVHEFGESYEDVFRVKNYLTNSDIAKLTSTSRQTVSAVLNQLIRKSLIKYDNEKMEIPKSAYLRIRQLAQA